MRDVLAGILTAHARGDSVALATVVRTWKSAPRPAGAALIVTSGAPSAGGASKPRSTNLLRRSSPPESRGTSPTASAMTLPCRSGCLAAVSSRCSSKD
jgi:hypothetical protein